MKQLSRVFLFMGLAIVNVLYAPEDPQEVMRRRQQAEPCVEVSALRPSHIKNGSLELFLWDSFKVEIEQGNFQQADLVAQDILNIFGQNMAGASAQFEVLVLPFIKAFATAPTSNLDSFLLDVESIDEIIKVTLRIN